MGIKRTLPGTPPRQGSRGWRKAVAAALLLGALAAPQPLAQEVEWPPGLNGPREPSPLPEPLVYLRDVDPSIVQDMRYAGADNFTGRRVPGYGASECVLLREAAEALARVQQALLPLKLSLKVYDCYRPRQAVRAFVDWVREGETEADPLRKRFHPNVSRSRLIERGYVTAVSHHSRGDTVDLTLVQVPAKRVAPFSRNTVYGPCTGPANERAPDTSVDMGTGFDCFDPLSHTAAAGITPTQRRWRETLLEAMRREGFRNYRKEWWHFTLVPSHSSQAFDVPIPPRRP
ncbi:MAG TPA: M15 family metallopeptidase [Hyphomicrobiaceae bacterium]|jgi:D-alanyl-D-alanine dipeptidase|nr:M15 family metallopeptidase [Hyphomicrobiaceae bacterium]